MTCPLHADGSYLSDSAMAGSNGWELCQHPNYSSHPVSARIVRILSHLFKEQRDRLPAIAAPAPDLTERRDRRPQCRRLKSLPKLVIGDKYGFAERCHTCRNGRQVNDAKPQTPANIDNDVAVHRCVLGGRTHYCRPAKGVQHELRQHGIRRGN